MQPALITVRVKPEIAQRLEKLASSMDRSKSFLAAEAIEEYLDLNEWQIQAIHEGLNASENGELIEFENIKQRWAKKLENPDL